MNKKCVIFDLDKTLTESKTNLDSEMADLICKLLHKAIVVVIGGGAFKQFEKQFLANLSCQDSILKNLYLFPTSGAECFKYDDGWQAVYRELLEEDDKTKIMETLEATVKKIFPDLPKDLYGPQIEDRGTQITFSALGQNAPISLKEKWDPDHSKKDALRDALAGLLPHHEVRTGGSTSIDITKLGIDKEYGVQKVSEYLGIPLEEMVFVGDALYPGGNDFPVTKTGIETISVTGPKETKLIIREMLEHA